MSVETFIPTGREFQHKTSTRWLKFKRIDDDIGPGLWRIHDGLYDFREFTERHPGGAEWLEMTEGQDITEAFEAAHIRGRLADAIAKKYFVRKIEKPRNSSATFEEKGFYKTLKQKAEKILYSKKVGGPGPTFRTYFLQDSLAFSFICLMFIAGLKNSWPIAIVAGLVLGMNTSCAHNFFHQSNTWRRFYWDMSLLSSWDWRVSHMLSHHLHTNTYNDIEVYGIEPFIKFLPQPGKNWIQRYMVHVYIHLFYFVGFPSQYVAKVISIFVLKEDKLRPEDLLPTLELFILWSLNGKEMSSAFALWIIMHSFSSFWLIFTSLIASHHHPDIYHAGDTPRKQTDWGLKQLDATRDVSKKGNSFFLVATTFGHHTLHHLFPTVDHSKLHLLYPILEETCKEFGTNYETKPQWDMLLGMHQQLIRNKGKDNFVR